MNLHEVTYSQGRITGSGIDLAVSEPSRKVLDEKGYEGKTVVFGIRPEDIHSEQIALDASPETVVEAEITVAELTGAESILYIDVGGTEMIAVVDARDYHQAGDKMEVAFNMNKAHFFDVETEEVIRSGAPSREKAVN